MRLARAALEQHVVGQHHGRFAVRRQDGHDVLQEVELLVRGGDEEVRALVVLPLGVDRAVVANDLVALLLAEGRIGQHHVIGAPARAEQRVLRLDDRVHAGDAVQIEVHRREAHDLRHDVDARELVLQRRIDRAVPRLRLLLHVLPGGEQKAGRAAGGIVHGLVRLGIDDRTMASITRAA